VVHYDELCGSVTGVAGPLDAEVIVVGAGPAGLVTALSLAQAGVDVIVLEAQRGIEQNLRGSTFHPSTLDMLEAAFGAATPLRARGLESRTVQYRRHGVGKIAEFDFTDIADATNHPFRVQAEQYKLCETLYEKIKGLDNVTVRFSSRVDGVRAAADSVQVKVDGVSAPLNAAFVVGADGANSTVRKAAGIEFEGFTWPERFLVISTPFDFRMVFPDLASVSYVADATEWYFLLRVPQLWRVMFPVSSDESDDAATAEASVQARLRRVHDRGVPYDVAHTTLYNVHQRVASRYFCDRMLLTGDAAHVNNPLGGMGMNGGIHDAFNLAEKLVAVLRAGAGTGEFERYEKERRTVALRYVQQVSIQNKRDLEASDPAAQQAFETRLREAQADPAKRRDLLMRLSMIASLQS
jgi:3-(3-hydroxy-phenyl)propionate hydroxylase